jgi:hypothetical protein
MDTNINWDSAEKKRELILIKKVISYINKLKNEIPDKEILDIELKKVFPSFVQNYTTIYKLALEGSDLSFLDIMIDQINEICNGNKNFDEARTDIGESLAERYLYPSFGKPNDVN